MSERCQHDYAERSWCPRCRAASTADPTPAGTGADRLAAERAAQIAECFVGSGMEERDDCARAIAAAIRYAFFGTVARAAPVAADARRTNWQAAGTFAGGTHYDGCWRDGGHHNCAVLEVERLMADARAEAGEPSEAPDALRLQRLAVIDCADHLGMAALDGQTALIPEFSRMFRGSVTRLLEMSRAATPPGAASGTREEGSMKNFEHLRMHAAEAREALAKAAPPSDDEPGSGDGLYYPLLFLTQTVEDTLKSVLRRAYEDVRPEIEQAEQWLARARAAVPPPSGEPE